MEIDVVQEDLRKATTSLKVPDLRRPMLRHLVRWATTVMPTPRIPGVTTSTVRDGSVRLRVYQPSQRLSDAALLWIHGGGLVIGNAKQDERLCAETSKNLGLTVVSADYRLAPDHPFPAAHDDVVTAWQWVQTHAAGLGVDAGKVAVGGESAGGGLAANLVHYLRDQSSVQPIAQWLFSPMLDDRTAACLERDAVDHWIWNNTANRYGWTAYLGQSPGASSVPDYAVAARRTDLTGLPPTWISVGDIELFFEEDSDYARRLADAGVAVAFEVVPGAPHGFENWAHDTTPARRLTIKAQQWLGRRVGTTWSEPEDADLPGPEEV